MGTAIYERIRALLARDGGATAAEYALLAALIAVAVVATVATLAPPLIESFSAADDGFAQGS